MWIKCKTEVISFCDPLMTRYEEKGSIFQPQIVMRCSISQVALGYVPYLCVATCLTLSGACSGTNFLTYMHTLELLVYCSRSTYTKIGTIQRRLAWPLRKDDTQIREAFHIFFIQNFNTIFDPQMAIVRSLPEAQNRLLTSRPDGQTIQFCDQTLTDVGTWTEKSFCHVNNFSPFASVSLVSLHIE